MKGSKFGETAKLIIEYNLSDKDFYIHKKNGKELTIVKRAGIEKIAKCLGVVFFGLDIKANDVCGEPMFIATINAKKKVLTTATPGDTIESWSDPVNTSASAARSNCIHDRYVEIVENRVKDRAILQLADLHEYHVHSEEGSNEFKEPISENGKTATKIITKKIDPVRDKMDSVDKIIDSMKTKRGSIKENQNKLK